MQDSIAALARLSRADLEAHRLRDRVQAIPKEIEKHEAELKRIRNLLDDFQDRLEEAQRERRALERDSEQARARRREVEMKQFRVKNATEYQALTKEIEEMRRRAGDFDEKALGILADEEAVQAEIARLSELAAQEEKRVEEIRTRLLAELESATRERDASERRREELVEQLDLKTRTRYERILKSKGDFAVVTLEGGACGGCYYQLPPQRVAEVRRGAALVICEGCGRMIVPEA
jgi:predicted  nucleic acid-binding Zn-ribbon protein